MIRWPEIIAAGAAREMDGALAHLPLTQPCYYPASQVKPSSGDLGGAGKLPLEVPEDGEGKELCVGGAPPVFAAVWAVLMAGFAVVEETLPPFCLRAAFSIRAKSQPQRPSLCVLFLPELTGGRAKP